MKIFIKLLVISFLFSLSYCKKKDDVKTQQPPPANNVEFKKTVYLINTNTDEELGMIMRMPIWKMDIYASGEKNVQGILVNVRRLLLVNPVTLQWLEIIYNGKYPSRITNNEGIIVECSNYNRGDLTFDETVTDTVHNKLIKPKIQIKLSETIFDNLDKAAAGLYTNTGTVPNGANDGSDCQKNKDLANLIGFTTSVAGCFIGGAEIVGSEGASLGLDPLGTVGTYYDCAQAVDYVAGGESFGCTEQYALDGLGVNTSCGRGIESTASAITCGVNALGLVADLSSCGACDKGPKKPGRSSGDPHITTMDGLRYDFQGYGEFIAAKSTTDNFEIQVRQVDAYHTHRVTVNTGIAVKVGNDVICGLVSPGRLYVNNKLLEPDFGTMTLTDGSTLLRNNYTVVITTPQGDEIIVDWFSDHYLDYIVTLADSRIGKETGLMGNFDGITTNDLMSSTGQPANKDTLFPKFADSWRVTPINSLFFYDSGRTTEYYTDRSFPQPGVAIPDAQISMATTACSKAGVHDEPYFGECVYDVAMTNDPGLVSSSLWIQTFYIKQGTTIPTTPENDINSFKDMRLELSTDQKDESQLDLINWRTGEVYALSTGKTNADNIDAVGVVSCSAYLFTPAALKACGFSCGIASLNEIIDNQDWATVRKGNFDSKTSLDADDPAQNQSNPIFIPISQWNDISSADAIHHLHGLGPLDPNANDASVNTIMVQGDVNCTLDAGIPYNHSVYRFITQEGKMGVFIVTGFGKIANSTKYYVTLDAKIEK